MTVAAEERATLASHKEPPRCSKVETAFTPGTAAALALSDANLLPSGVAASTTRLAGASEKAANLLWTSS